MVQDDNRALVPITVEPPRTTLPTPSELSVIGTLARTVVAARGHAVPASIDSPAKAAAVMIAGWELGARPMTALRHIFVVNGRTEPDAQLMAGILMAREPDATLEVIELTSETCTMRIRRPRRGVVAEFTYTIADARHAGLLKNGNPWSLYPRDMLRWACTKRLCRAYAPDLINAVGVDLGTAEALVDEARSEPAPIDVESLAPGELYNEGDRPTAETQEQTPETGPPATPAE